MMVYMLRAARNSECVEKHHPYLISGLPFFPRAQGLSVFMVPFSGRQRGVSHKTWSGGFEYTRNLQFEIRIAVISLSLSLALRLG